MDAVIVFESLTGTTQRAASVLADELYQRGMNSKVYSSAAVDRKALEAADLVIVGTWTDGVVLFGQRPGRGGRLKTALGDLSGRRCAVFATYAINPGKVLDKLSHLVEAQGGEVLGGMTVHAKKVDEHCAELADRLVGALAE